ncbi:MAG: leucyl/phenylalanyl-tRNA--protein transferase [Verrucomicrobia bacterium]|jgi:leucyl/phenylalanyl-tRNA--protein transferase|nr:leucyl/phenylalanyl-tRNA--protein transferase [Verrucomicrobiota bacterium]
MGTPSQPLSVALPAVLTGRAAFPDPRGAGPDGLVAVGGDLSVHRLQAAYRHGVFPWTVNPVTWWSPDPRGILELEAIHIPRSLRRVLRAGEFTVTLDRDFRGVMSACAGPRRGRRSTWITKEFIEAYEAMHRAGHAHSLEVWLGDQLAGGIYGVCQGGLFAGESMFHRVSNASKVALVRLAEHLRAQGFVLFDVQMLTPVTRLMGGAEIPRAEYLERLSKALRRNCSFS